VDSRVNFINILPANFLYKSALGSFFLVTVWLCNFLAQKYWQKAARKMLMELTLSQTYDDLQINVPQIIVLNP